MMFTFPVELTPDDNGTIMARIVGLPGATFGDGAAEALANAVDLLETICTAFITDRQDIPAPEEAAGRPTVTPSLLGSLKLAVYAAMRDRGWRKADLARAMALNPRQIDRLLDLRHASTVAQLEQALRICGREFEIATEARVFADA